jgi:hypothetical protein
MCTGSRRVCVAGNIVAEGEEPANPGFSEGEQDLEIRPTLAELQRAWKSAPARRVSVHCVVRGGKRFDVQPVIEPVVHHEDGTTRIGAMTFQNGHMACWGVTSRGVPLKPIEQLRSAKGSREKPPARNLRWLVQSDAPIAKNAKFLAGTTHSTGRSGACRNVLPSASSHERRKSKLCGARSARTLKFLTWRLVI